MNWIKVREKTGRISLINLDRVEFISTADWKQGNAIIYFSCPVSTDGTGVEDSLPTAVPMDEIEALIMSMLKEKKQ